MDAYCQHGLKGLDRSYRREDTLEARYEVTKMLTAFVLGEALGFDLEQLRTRYGHSTEANQAESKFD